MMKNLPSLLMTLFVAAAAAAQAPPPALFVRDAGETTVPLRIAKVQTIVRVHGPLAETKTTLTFANPNPRVLEGEFVFPLPEGAAVSGYALDIDGKMVDASAVERTRGRIAFEEIVRRGIDPGLLEWAKGDNFRTRVFPIPAGGSRTVRVEYVVELPTPGGRSTYRLPLDYCAPLDEFHLRIEVMGTTAAPDVLEGGPSGLEFHSWKKGYLAEVRLEKVAITEDLVIALPQTGRPTVLVEESPEGEVFFAIHDRPPEDPRAPDRLQARAAFRRLAVLWDASVSRTGHGRDREIELLEQVLRASSRRRLVTVDLVVFRDAAEPPRRFVIDGGTADLVEALREVPYDGGTRMGAIGPLPKRGRRPEAYLLFTDGLGTLGEGGPAAFDAPLYTISADGVADHRFLRRLASRNRGRHLNLKRMSVDEAVSAIGWAPMSFLGVEVGQGRVADLLPEAPIPVGESILITGRLEGDRARLTLLYGVPGRVLERRSVRISRDAASEGRLVTLAWARRKVEDLLAAGAAEERIVEVGKKYRIVTPFTSLIVLDNLEQYVEHRIMPPDSLPEMQERYRERVAEDETWEEERKEEKIEYVLDLWGDRVAWWETEFEFPRKAREEKEEGPSGPDDIGIAGGAREAEVEPERRPTPEECDEMRRRRRDHPRGHMGVAGIVQGTVIHEGGPKSGRRAEFVQVTLEPQNRCFPPMVLFTDENGFFKFANVDVGLYGLYAFEPGFVSTQIVGIDVQPNTLREFILRLQPSEKLVEEIMVVAGRSRLETRETSLSASLHGDTIQRLSLRNQRVQDIILFFPGISRSGHSEGTDVSLMGGTSAQIGYRLDGPNLSDILAGGPVRKQGHVGPSGVGPAIALTPWDPKTPYLKEIRRAGEDHAYETYLHLREEHGTSPAFYLDCGQFFLEAGRRALGVRILTTIADLRLEDAGLLRVLAHRLAQLDELELAAGLFEEILRIRPEEPQSRRGLALVLARGEEYRRALELLHEVVMGDWDGRFPEIEMIALTELNALLPRAEVAGVDPARLGIDPRLIRLLDVDLRIVLTWDTDMTDMDLWVIEPSGEECFYRHPDTRIGGHLSEDFTEGYGPEEYMLGRAMPGRYAVQVVYYGSDAVRLIGPVTLQVEIFTDYGRPEERRRSLTVRLAEEDEEITVGEVVF